MVNDVQYIIDPERVGALGGADLANPYARFTPALGASAQDFSYGKSIFDVMDGNPDGESVSGVAGISLIDEDSPKGKGRNRDKDADEGGLSWDDVRDARERMREQIRQISIAGIPMTREQLDETISDLSDPDKRDRIAQDYASKNNTTLAKARDEVDRVSQYLIAKRAMEDGIATLEQRMLINKFEADPDAASRIKRVLEAQSNVNAEAEANHAAVQARANPEGIIARLRDADVVAGNAVVANVEDEALWEDARAAQGISGDDLNWTAQTRGSNDVGTLAFSDTREGPVISATYNASSSGSLEVAQAEAVATPVRSSTFDQALG